jgi:hypothetical protein
MHVYIPVRASVPYFIRSEFFSFFAKEFAEELVLLLQKFFPCKGAARDGCGVMLPELLDFWVERSVLLLFRVITDMLELPIIRITLDHCMNVPPPLF